MKIGILTFHRAVNYGAVLQAYALQHTLENFGCDAEIIDYRCPFIENSASPLYGFKNKKGFASSFKQFIFRSRKDLGFHLFFKKNIHLSKKVSTEKELAELSHHYDKVFTGSDQVWNRYCTENDVNYFLSFVDEPQKKISYAASFGYDRLQGGNNVDYKKLLSDFNCISVREKIGTEVVKEVSGRNDAQVVLDPTLLLSADDWKKFVGKRPLKEKYIFVYYLRAPKNLITYVNELAQKTGCRVIDAKNSKAFFLKNSPSDFLSWIYHSEYFVTNSFHGTVFSLIFRKQFAVELKNDTDVNTRAKDLLDLVKLDRDLSLDNIDAIDNEINYTSVHSILSIERAKSLDYIKHTLGIIEDAV